MILRADSKPFADNIESNVTSVEADTRLAGDELNVAHEYQRRAGRRMICLLLVMVIVITIVLLAVSYKALAVSSPSHLLNQLFIRCRFCHDHLCTLQLLL